LFDQLKNSGRAPWIAQIFAGLRQFFL